MRVYSTRTCTLQFIIVIVQGRRDIIGSADRVDGDNPPVVAYGRIPLSSRHASAFCQQAMARRCQLAPVREMRLGRFLLTQLRMYITARVYEILAFLYVIRTA
jgi:hypothetical protein